MLPSKMKLICKICLYDEIEITKPSHSSLQALTFSNYKSCNTCKILISVTPNGHIQFISKAYSCMLQ